MVSSTVCRPVRVRAVRALLFSAFVVSSAALQAQTAAAQTAAAPSTLGSIDGQVYDSLSKMLARRATVWIPGTAFTTTADDRGHFVLDSVPPGRQVLAFSSAELDSAGLGSLAAAVEVRAGRSTHAELGSPSLRTLWMVMCKGRGTVGNDSGIVYGTVRDGDNNTRLVRAPTQFSWYDMRKKGLNLNFVESRPDVLSDSTGTYYACGLPTDVIIASRAFGNKASSGEVEYRIGTRGILRSDFMVSKELGRLENTHGSATVRGVVHDIRGTPMYQAIVTIAAADTSVRTNADGVFTFTKIPAGTHGIQVRKLGFAQTTKIVDLMPNAVTEVDLLLPSATTLATLNVRAKQTMKMEEQEFLDRRKEGLGILIDFDKRDLFDPVGSLSNIPRVKLSYGRGGVPSVSMLNGTRSCSPGIYLDGVPTDIEMMRDYPTERIRYVEVFNSAYFLPAQFIKSAINPCGAIAYWTKNRWQ